MWHLFQNVVPTMVAVQELDKVIQTEVTMLANIEYLKPGLEVCVNVFKGKNIVYLLPTGFAKRQIYQFELLVVK